MKFDGFLKVYREGTDEEEEDGEEGGEGRLILTGVMLSTGSGALISLLLTLSDDKSLRGIFFWLMGDLDENEVCGQFG